MHKRHYLPKNVILFLILSFFNFLMTQNDIWTSTSNHVFHVQLDHLKLFIERFTQSDVPDTIHIPLPREIMKEKKASLHDVRLLFNRLFVFIKVPQKNNFNVLELHPDSLHIKKWYLNVSEQEEKSSQQVRIFQYDDGNFRYEAFRIKDSSQERIFLNKYKRVTSHSNPWKYEKIWQHDFEKRKISQLRIQKIKKDEILFNAYISDGTKKGWWALILNNSNGKLKYYRRLTTEDSVAKRIYYYKYDSATQYHIFIIGDDFHLAEFGRHKNFTFHLLDSVLEPVRTWSLYPNINMKILKSMNMERFQPLHFSVKIKNEVDIEIFVWCWASKKGFYFPVSLNFRKTSIDNPYPKLSLNNEPEELIVQQSDFSNVPSDTLSGNLPLDDFSFYHPYFLNEKNLDYAVYIPSGKNKHTLFFLSPVPKTGDKYSFSIIEKKEADKSGKFLMFFTKQHAWLINTQKNKITYFKSLY